MRFRGLWVGALLGALGLVDASAADLRRAADVLSGGIEPPGGCLSPVLQATASRQRPIPVRRRALRTLREIRTFDGRSYPLVTGGEIVYRDDPMAFERIDGPDLDLDGVPDRVERIARAVDDARERWTASGFADPGRLQVVLLRGPSRVRGYAAPLEDGARLVLEVPHDADPAEVDRMARHQLAHAVALYTGAGVPPAWAEAFAQWAALDGGALTGVDRSVYEERLSTLAGGLESEELSDAIGNALFFHAIEEAFAPTAVRTVLEELGEPQPFEAALQKGLLRGSGTTLAEGLREFQLWSLLVGDRSDGRHFRFAESLGAPALAARDVPADAAVLTATVGPLGLWQAGLTHDGGDGGARLELRGDLSARWAADLLLLERDGTLVRVAIPVDERGRGRLDWPLEPVLEASILVRRLDPDGPPATVRIETRPLADFPFRWQDDGPAAESEGTGVWIRWNTWGERSMAGFHVYRSDDGGPFRRVSPIGVPATGSSDGASGYAFFDAAPPRDVPVRYRIEGRTRAGLRVLRETPPLDRDRSR